jgi:hypothetical protein
VGDGVQGVDADGVPAGLQPDDGADSESGRVGEAFLGEAGAAPLGSDAVGEEVSPLVEAGRGIVHLPTLARG